MTDNGRDDLEMIRNPDRWPHTFVLPVKRNTDGVVQFGFLFQGSMNTPCPPPEPIVYIGNVSALSKDNPPSNYPTKRYGTLLGIVTDGWMVD